MDTVPSGMQTPFYTTISAMETDDRVAGRVEERTGRRPAGCPAGGIGHRQRAKPDASTSIGDRLPNEGASTPTRTVLSRGQAEPTA